MLLGTDVLGRGIDVPNVRYVLNLEPPPTLDDYKHRKQGGRPPRPRPASTTRCSTHCHVSYALADTRRACSTD